MAQVNRTVPRVETIEFPATIVAKEGLVQENKQDRVIINGEAMRAVEYVVRQIAGTTLFSSK